VDVVGNDLEFFSIFFLAVVRPGSVLASERSCARGRRLTWAAGNRPRDAFSSIPPATIAPNRFFFPPLERTIQAYQAMVDKQISGVNLPS